MWSICNNKILSADFFGRKSALVVFFKAQVNYSCRLARKLCAAKNVCRCWNDTDSGEHWNLKRDAWMKQCQVFPEAPLTHLTPLSITPSASARHSTPTHPTGFACDATWPDLHSLMAIHQPPLNIDVMTRTSTLCVFRRPSYNVLKLFLKGGRGENFCYCCLVSFRSWFDDACGQQFAKQSHISSDWTGNSSYYSLACPDAS